MIKSILTAGISLLALATTADARTFGHIAGTASYADQDVFFGKSADLWKYGVQGAIGFDVTPTWNVQFDASYNGDNYSSDDFSGDLSYDFYRAGTQIFWRDPSKGLFGVEVAYQSTGAFGNTFEGFLASLRGEYFSSDTLTFGGAVTYDTYDLGEDADTWGGNVFATYYSSDQLGLTLRATYKNLDIGSIFGTSDTFGVSADVEYLFQNNLSLSGVVGYSSNDYFGNGDFAAVTVGAKLKFYFGTEGTLANQHRTSTLETTYSDLGLLLLD